MGLEHYRDLGIPAEVLPLKGRDDAGNPDLVRRVGTASMVFFPIDADEDERCSDGSYDEPDVAFTALPSPAISSSALGTPSRLKAYTGTPSRCLRATAPPMWSGCP